MVTAFVAQHLVPLGVENRLLRGAQLGQKGLCGLLHLGPMRLAGLHPLAHGLHALNRTHGWGVLAFLHGFAHVVMLFLAGQGPILEVFDKGVPGGALCFLQFQRALQFGQLSHDSLTAAVLVATAVCRVLVHAVRGGNGRHAGTAEQRSRHNPDHSFVHFRLLEGVNPLWAVSDGRQMGVLNGAAARKKCLKHRILQAHVSERAADMFGYKKPWAPPYHPNMTSSPDRVLLVDDDPEIRQLTAQYLEQNGVQCSTAANGREMRHMLQSHRMDLLVLDVMMPGEDGLTICRDLRAQGSPHAALPILMLTARTDDADRILGLEMGADDYLGKPFVPRELLARIRAILRRSRALPGNLQSANSPLHWQFSGYTLDAVTRQVRNPDGVLLVLTSGEYRVLHVLLQHANKVLSRDQLLELTQGRTADAFDRSIDLLISRLRLRLGEPARSLGLIKTVRSEGYVLATEVQAQ